MNPRYDARTAFIIAVGINGITHAEIPVALGMGFGKFTVLDDNEHTKWAPYYIE